MDAAPPVVALNPTWSQSLRTLAARGMSRRYRKGTVLIQEGDVGETLFIVLSGQVQAYSTDERGREIIYGVYGPGECLGEMSLDGGPRSASVMTTEPTLCAVVTRVTLREHIAADPEFAFELIARVIRRARLATQSARNMALLDTYGRLASTLQQLSALQADGRRAIKPKITHAQLASRIGCSREMVSRLMKDLSAGHYLAQEGNAIVLTRPLPTRW